MTERQIWDYLMNRLDNPFGVAGLMGNLYAESGLRADDLEGRAEKRLGMMDAEYTAAVDDGSYSYEQFIGDGAGYGLAQWTHKSRKAAFYRFMTGFGKSIGDGAAQMLFLWDELQGYQSVLGTLRAAQSIREASDAVLHGYERPANQSASVEEKRAKYAQQFYNKYHIEGAGNMAKIPCNTLIGDFQKMLADKWGYIPNTSGEIWTKEKQEKSTNSTVQKYGAQWIGCHVADCSGAFVYAYKQHGESIYHGSNRIARKYIVELLPITQARPGMAAFKMRKPGEQGYALPSEYKNGGEQYNGDLNDYYHIGLVDNDPDYVLNSQGTRTGFVRSKIKDNWHYVGYLKAVEYSEETEPTGEPLYYARVQADNGKPVNLRREASTNAGRICTVNVGTTVAVWNTIVNGNEQWAEISYGERRGYMMAKFLYAATPTDNTPGAAPEPDPDTPDPLDAARQWLDQAAEYNRLEREAIETAQAMIAKAAQDRG